MKKLYTIVIGFILALSLTGAGFSCDACKVGSKKPHKSAHKTKIQTQQPSTSQAPQSIISASGQKQETVRNVQSAQNVQNAQNANVYTAPLDVLNAAPKYLNKPIHIKAKFDKFSTLGLDYPPAMRSSADYIAFLVQRNDVLDHNVPLSEIKFFLKRDYAEKFIDLDTGDVVLIDGKMFSNALTDVWIDVDKIEIKEKVKKAENK